MTVYKEGNKHNPTHKHRRTLSTHIKLIWGICYSGQQVIQIKENLQDFGGRFHIYIKTKKRFIWAFPNVQPTWFIGNSSFEFITILVIVLKRF